MTASDREPPEEFNEIFNNLNYSVHSKQRPMQKLVELSLDSSILSQLKFTQANDHVRVQVLDDGKPRVAKPEEIVRQLVVASLIIKYGYQPPSH